MKAMSNHALAAKMIRKELKEKFPKHKFSVTSEAFSMGNSVRVSWIDGPKHDDVKSMISKYQYGHFDGMRDCYEYTNVIKDIPQVKYVQTSRDISEEIYLAAFEFGREHFSEWKTLKSIDEYTHLIYEGRARCFLRRNFYNIDLSEGFKVEMVVNMEEPICTV